MPAATRGKNPCPHVTAITTETGSKVDTEHKTCNTSAGDKHLSPWYWARLNTRYRRDLIAERTGKNSGPKSCWNRR